MASKEESDLTAIENFGKYLRIKTVHPKPDYDGCVKFLTEIAKEIGLEHEIIEVQHYMTIFVYCFVV